MRREIERWLLQSREELETAKVCLDGGKYFAAAFWSQQSAEKALKAAYIHKKKTSPGTTHSLTYLGRELSIPKEFWTLLRDLTKEYYMSRYPDASEDVPYKLYTKEDAVHYIEICRRLLEWVESALKK